MHTITSPPTGGSDHDPPPRSSGADTGEHVDLPELADLADAQLLHTCRLDELDRRRTEGLLIHRMVEIERRKLYAADGFKCLAAWGRGVQRWNDLEARSRRNLTKLAMVEPQVVQRLVTGRLGVAQAHLLGRLFKTPRVGQFVPLFIDDFLDQAAELSYADFEQHVRNWRLLADQDGPDPERAHRQRGASLQFSDHEFRMVMNGPAIDGAKFKALLQRFEQIEFDLDWAAAKQQWGDDARPDLMGRTSQQRRYDAFVNLLAHVHLPAGTDQADHADHASGGRADTTVDVDVDVDVDVNVNVDDEVEADPFDDGSADASVEAADVGSADASVTPTPGTTPGTSGARGADGAVSTVVNITIDLHTYLHSLERLFGTALYRHTPAPFGADRACSQTLDGTFISPRDAVLASLYGKVRLVVTDETGQPVQMTRIGRLFTGPMRDAVLMLATRCTHPGCDRSSTDCHIDHLVPHSTGGPTQVDNGGPACPHHNNWRYTSGARARRQPSGRWTTHRKDGTEIAPPD